MTKVTKEMINAAHDVTMKSKLMLGHELLEKIYLAMDSQRTWVGLTSDEISAINLRCLKADEPVYSAVRIAEAKLKEKNT